MGIKGKNVIGKIMTEPLTMMYIKTISPSPRGSIFSNFETVQASTIIPLGFDLKIFNVSDLNLIFLKRLDLRIGW